MMMTPSTVRRRPARAAARVRTPDGNPDAARLKRNSTAVLTLFTFCPPGPDDRTNVSSSARSGTDKDGDRTTMGGFYNRSIDLSIYRSIDLIRIDPTHGIETSQSLCK